MRLLVLFTLVLVFACNKQTKVEPITEADKELLSEAQENFEALPDSIIDKEAKKDLIALGKELYFEKKLSANGTISCNSCHMLDKYGVDNEKTSPGHDGTRGERNSPTSYNAALHIAQFWDGRAKDVEEQALGPLLNPIEHGVKDEKQALEILEKAGYKEKFTKAFGNDTSFTYKNIGVAIGAYERTLLTPSRFDDYLKGDINALTKGERAGLKKFVEVGCTTCHNGVGVGGGMYQKLGVAEEYETEDKGRFNVTKNEEDMHVFKVPGLRNVVHTGSLYA
jgi:cytochrome c peroxidase